MPLTLVTGPANAAKAGAVLGRLRERTADQPVLVVPSFEDVEHNQRELAAAGAVFGVSVLRSGQLFGLIAERAGLAARVASELQRGLLVEAAVGASNLRVLAESARLPGFHRAAGAFFAELERSAVSPARFTSAVRAWGGRPYAEEVAEVYRRYRAALDDSGLVAAGSHAWLAVEALRADPASWGATPVFVYGFDDFTPAERDALDALSRDAGADVVVSLPYEPDRVAFRATEHLHDELAAIADRVEVLEPRHEHYAESSRPALHALERGLYRGGPAGVPAAGAIRRHEAGGERAEVELCAAEVLALLRAGTTPGDVAVVLRRPDSSSSLIEQVFGAYDIPWSIDRRVEFRHTGLGRGLLALLRCTGPEGAADDVLAYLRTAGVLRKPGLADSLEAEARRRGVTTAAEALEIWNGGLGPFQLDAPGRLADKKPEALLAQLGRELERLLAAPYERQAHLLAGAELDDVRAFRAAHEAVRDLYDLARGGSPVALDRERIQDTLAALRVRVGEASQPDRVQVASPEAIRARRFDAVFVLGLQEGEFPRTPAPDPFLPDADRGALGAASGLRLARRADEAARERYLFYVCASRARELLVLSSRSSDEEGGPQARSFLIDEVEELFPELRETVRRRSLADVVWDLDEAPTEAEWDRAVARRGPRRPPAPVGPILHAKALDVLAARDAVSASALEHFFGCPVRWLVDDVLRPEALEPDAEPLVRGSLAHRVLEVTFGRLREETGERRVTPGNLERAEAILVATLEAERGGMRLAAGAARVRAALRRLQFDLLRYLRHCATDESKFEPEHLELTFGLAESPHPAVALDGGPAVRGMIDRVDVWNGKAVVRDYKSGKVGGYKASDWQKEGRLQAALYMLAVRELLGLEPVAGLYTPLGGEDRRSRGMARSSLAEELGTDLVRTDLVDDEQFDATLDWARAEIGRLAAEMRSGRLASCPGTCAYRGGCSHPSICRING